jgi:hypothetical protein
VINAEAKKQGLIVDYNQGDEDKQRELSSKRLDMRKFLGVTYMREVNLRPIG